MNHSAGDGRHLPATPSSSGSGPPPEAPLFTWLRRRWKDLSLILLAVSTLVLGGLLWREMAPAASSRGTAAGPGEGVPVSVFDVVLDRENRRFIEVLFDGPVVEEGVGDILDRPPATLSPSVGGTWRWKEQSVLRFDVSGRLPMATEFTLSFIPVRFEAAGRLLVGEREFTLRTDQFRVERIEVQEESSGDDDKRVLFTGRIHFNYPVTPGELATRIRLFDITRPESEAVDVILQTTWASSVISFRTAAVRKSKDARTLRLAIFADLTPSQGNVSLGEEFVQEIPLGSSDILEVRSFDVRPGEAESTLRIGFSSPVSPSMAVKYLSIDPELEIRPSAAGNDLLLTGAFGHGQSYQVSLAADLPARDNAVLREAWRTRIHVPNLKPSVDFQSEGVFLPRSGIRKLALSTVNVEQVELVVERVFLNNLFFMFQYAGFGSGGTTYKGYRVRRALGSTVFEKPIDIAGPRNRTVITPLEVEELIGDPEPGLYRLAVNRPGEWQATQRLLLLTDLGLVAKQWHDGFLVWVSSVADLSSVPGARVRLISEQNQVLAEGVTGDSGLWRTDRIDTSVDGERPYMVTVEKGGDFSFLLLDRMKVDTTGLDVSGGEVPSDGYSGYLYGERDLYRPGEIVRGVAVLRDRMLRAPPSMPAVLRHRDPQGLEGETRLLTTDDRGIAEFEFRISGHALTGRHVLEMLVADDVVGQYGFQVEEFVPDRIKVEITPTGGEPAPGENLGIEVAGTYLFGPPGAGLPVEARVRIEDATFSAPDFPEFTFRNDERELSSREIFSEEGLLDDDGHMIFEAATPEGLVAPSTLDAVITARVMEQGGRGVTGVARKRIHPYPYYVGLKRSFEGYAEPGRSSSFEFAAVRPDGKPTASGALNAELFRDRWHTVLRRLPSGDYRYESSRDPELVDSQRIPAGESTGEFSFNIPEYGSFRVVLTDPETEASAQVSFYASGWGYSPWAVGNPSRIELELDREEYRPGESAKVLVKAPFPGRLLLSVERDGVYHARVHRLEGNTAELSVPVTAGMRPNAYVTATLVRSSEALEPGAVARAYGAVPIAVDRMANRIDVQISAPGRMHSHSELEVTVRSRPGSAVTVAAVDEGILQLIAQATPDPFSFFYRKLALAASTYDTYTLLLPQVRAEGAAAAGGGEAGSVRAQYLRTDGMRRAEPVARWSGVLRADGAGRATARFPIPEFQGAVRIMAVSLDAQRFGSASHTVQVRDPIVLTPTLPRFLAPGERIRLPVTVRNDTGRIASIAVSLAAEGPVSISGPATREVSVPDGREKTVHFDLETPDRTGPVSFVARAEGNGESASATARLAVRPYLPAQTREKHGYIASRETVLPIEDAGWARAGTLKRTVRIGSLPLVQFSGKLDSLLRYPYGCLEQTVSSAFPLLYLEDLARALVPDLFEGREGAPTPAEYVQAGIERVRAFRLRDGAFSLWPGTQRLDAWATIYASHFLVEARRAGFSVDDAMHDGALDYLAGSLPSVSNTDLKRAAYTLYVLARAGRPDEAMMDYVREKKLDEMSSESKALLAASFAMTGTPSAIGDLLSRVRDAAKVERSTGRNLDSTLRNRALILLALLEARPGDPLIEELVERITRDLSGSTWWSTQESAFALLAVGQFIRTQREKPPYSGKVFVGASEIGSFGPEPVTFTGIEGTDPVRVVMDPGYEKGSAFFSVSARGIPTDESFFVASAGLEIEREFLDRNGEIADLESVEQGELLVARTRIRSVAGPVENVVIQQLLPTGLDVENPRLATTESLPWVEGSSLSVDYLDLRDDRVLMFVSLGKANQWETGYALLRAVTPGTFHLPPPQAEAMYNGALRAAGELGSLRVRLPGEEER